MVTHGPHASHGLFNLSHYKRMLDSWPVYKELVAKGLVVRARNVVGTEIYVITRWAAWWERRGDRLPSCKCCRHRATDPCQLI